MFQINLKRNALSSANSYNGGINPKLQLNCIKTLIHSYTLIPFFSFSFFGVSCGPLLLLCLLCHISSSSYLGPFFFYLFLIFTRLFLHLLSLVHGYALHAVSDIWALFTSHNIIVRDLVYLGLLVLLSFFKYSKDLK